MIEVEGLRKTYRIGFWRKPVQALRGVSFRVDEGDLYGFIGPNGAGKSTAIKILLGLLMPGEGRAMLMGKPAGTPESRAQVGFLPEHPYFYDYLTGWEFLSFYGRISGLSGSGLRRRIEEVMELAGVGEAWTGRRLRTYSKGMLQRMGLAQALLGKPRLVILDEPMSGLDPLGRRHVRNLLKRLHAEGVTVFYSSHVLSDVEALCTRLAMVVSGEIRRQGTVQEVMAGEEESYQVSLAADLEPGDPPREIAEVLGARLVRCRKSGDKDAFLRWAVGRGLGVEEVRRTRHSLEDVLAEEVARIA
jgi:ABC-2 type transport system ATP-binding protein